MGVDKDGLHVHAGNSLRPLFTHNPSFTTETFFLALIPSLLFILPLGPITPITPVHFLSSFHLSLRLNSLRFNPSSADFVYYRKYLLLPSSLPIPCHYTFYFIFSLMFLLKLLQKHIVSVFNSTTR